MKLFSHIAFVILMPMILLSTNSLAELPSTISDISNDDWEIHAEAGIAVYIKLIQETTKTEGTYYLILYVKNIATTQKEYALGGPDDGIRYFYTDAQGVQHDLHPLKSVFIQTRLSEIRIAPSKIITLRVKLDNDDLHFVESHPIQADFLIFDVYTKQKHEIVSLPKTLSTPN